MNSGPVDLERASSGPGGLFYGVYPAIVTDLQDPDSQGRVKVRLPWSPDTAAGADIRSYDVWARVAVLMAGNNRGSWFIPEVDDEVLVSFEAGNPRRPYVVGALWNGRDAAPETMNNTNDIKSIVSRTGIRITLDDTSGAVKLKLETPGGHTVTLDDGQVSITVEDTSGSSIKLAPEGVTITTSAKVSVKAGAMIEMSAGMVKVDAGMSKFSGVVQCDTMISNAVVSSSYTPGAGNIW